MIKISEWISQDVEKIIFDWNGTLLNDASYSLNITNGILIELGMEPISLERYRQIFKFPIREYYNDLGFDFGKYSFEDISNEWIKRYMDTVREVDLFAGCEDLIKKIQAQGRRIAILSAAQEDHVHQLLDFHGIDQCFDEVFGLSHSHAHSKIERGKELLSLWGGEAERLMLIGDTDHDYEVGQALQIDTLILADGHQGMERLGGLSCPVISDRYFGENVAS